MKLTSSTLLLISVIILTNCGLKKELISDLQSEDFIYVGEYTLGLEGPAVSASGDLYFVNPTKSGTIGKVDITEQTFEIFIDTIANGSIANGIRFNSNGEMFLADYINHNVLKVDLDTKEVSVFANDTTMNQPNDIAITRTNILFASDPNWANETGNIWRIDTSGTVTLLESNMGTTNGIEVSPGDSILYVNESVQRKIWAYDLDEVGNITTKRLLIEFDDFGLDGMRCDVEGNLYVARYGKGVIAIVSPKGKLIKEIILTAKKPTNVAFGGAEGKSVFVTCQDRGYIEMFTAESSGRSFNLHATINN